MRSAQANTRSASKFTCRTSKKTPFPYRSLKREQRNVSPPRPALCVSGGRDSVGRRASAGADGMRSSMEGVAARIEAVLPELVAIRRNIHAHPEIGREERRTAALVADRLRAWGIQTTENVGGFGVVGTLRGRRPGQGAIGLRADMDALAIVEQTGLPYASTNAGRMHACGHDGHTAMLLGAARVLA